MASIEYGGAEGLDDSGADTGGRAARLSRAINLAGGVVSLALIGGLTVWGYQLLMRDVTGVPVVRALEGPIRVAPEDPGGRLAEHQGLAVNEIAAAGTAAGPVDQVQLAPPAANLAEEDLPAAELTAMMAPTPDLPVVDSPEDALPTDMAVAEALAPELPQPTGDPEADALALAEAIAAGVAPLSELAPAEGEDIAAAVPLRDDRGIARSPRPPARPAGLDTVAAAPAAEVTDVAQVSSDGAIEIDVDTLVTGTRLVQLGAFPSAEVARAQWGEIGGRFEDVFDGKRRVVQRAESGGKIFYRLRAEGFADLSDARRFCSTLVSAGADCIPVELR
ncbi:SPOR domain-containing protein [Rhodobacteraceae bacterium CCMM004]|nr:SPOR domain-containing protein [Rhodobacteraceae bacterium CCMM004]